MHAAQPYGFARGSSPKSLDAGEAARHREPATSLPCELGEVTAGAMLCLVEHVLVAEERSVWDDTVNATVTAVERVEVGTTVSAIRWKLVL